MPDRAGKTVVEVLYPEYANQAGDNGNAMYLRACLPDATFVETSHDDVPYFAEHVPSLVLLCGMSEAQQEKTIELLMPYRDRLNELVDAGVPMLFTGSAPEVLGSKIVNPDGSEVCGLGILELCDPPQHAGALPRRRHRRLCARSRPAAHQGRRLQDPVHPGGGARSRRASSATTRWALASTRTPSSRASARTTSWQRGSLARCSRSTPTSRAFCWISWVEQTRLSPLRRMSAPPTESASRPSACPAWAWRTRAERPQT